MKMTLICMKMKLHAISHERFRTQTRFETEAQEYITNGNVDRVLLPSKQSSAKAALIWIIYVVLKCEEQDT